MLSLFPSILFMIQGIFLYFEREILNADSSYFWVITKIVLLNIVTISFVNTCINKKSDRNRLSKINEKLGSRKNNLIIFFIYVFFFLVQVLIRKNIPLLDGFVLTEVIYTSWPVSPFSGFMSVLFILILGERISVWANLRKDTEKSINNILVIGMVLISLLMLRRDLLALLILGYGIKIYIIIVKLIKVFITQLKLKKYILNQFISFLIILFVILILFTLIGGLRGMGTGVNRKYWEIFSLYISTPLSNSLTLIRYEDSGFLGFPHFIAGGSEFGQAILNYLGLSKGALPRDNFVMPQFNLISSLGYFYQVFGKELYIFIIGIYSGILAILEINWKKKEPILYSIILLIASASIFYHYYGSLTITIVFPFIFLIHKFRIRL